MSQRSYAAIVASPAKAPAATPTPIIEVPTATPAPAPKTLSVNQENRLLRRLRKEALREKMEQKAHKQLSEQIEEEKEKKKLEKRKEDKKEKKKKNKEEKKAKEAKKEMKKRRKEAKAVKPKPRKVKEEVEPKVEEPVPKVDIPKEELSNLVARMTVRQRGGAPSEDPSRSDAPQRPSGAGIQTNSTVIREPSEENQPTRRCRIDVGPLSHSQGPKGYLCSTLLAKYLQLRVEESGEQVVVLDSGMFLHRHTEDLAGQIQKMLDNGAEIVIFPVCLRRHWTMLICQKDKLHHFNPSQSAFIPKKVASFCRRSLKREPKPIDRPDTPRQTDDINCGVVVALMAEAIIRRRWLTQGELDVGVAGFRSKFTLELLHLGYECFIGDEEERPDIVESDSDVSDDEVSNVERRLSEADLLDHDYPQHCHVFDRQGRPAPPPAPSPLPTSNQLEKSSTDDEERSHGLLPCDVPRRDCPFNRSSEHGVSRALQLAKPAIPQPLPLTPESFKKIWKRVLTHLSLFPRPEFWQGCIEELQDGTTAADVEKQFMEVFVESLLVQRLDRIILELIYQHYRKYEDEKILQKIKELDPGFSLHTLDAEIAPSADVPDAHAKDQRRVRFAIPDSPEPSATTAEVDEHDAEQDDTQKRSNDGSSDAEPPRKLQKIVRSYTIVGTLRFTKEVATITEVTEQLRLIGFELADGDTVKPTTSRPSKLSGTRGSYFLRFETDDPSLIERLDQFLQDATAKDVNGVHWLLVPDSSFRDSYLDTVFLIQFQAKIPIISRATNPIFGTRAWNGERHDVNWLERTVTGWPSAAKEAYLLVVRDVQNRIRKVLGDEKSKIFDS